MDGLKIPISSATRIILLILRKTTVEVKKAMKLYNKVDVYILFGVMIVLPLYNEKKVYSVLGPQTVIINILREKVNS